MKYIPENLKIVLQAPKEISYTVLGETITKEVRPAFVTDAAKSQGVALRWAQDGSQHWVNGKRVTREGAGRIVSVPNKPFSQLQLVNLERREEGGRAYKVVTEDGYLVDLREDVLFDVLMTSGAAEGGVLRGAFVWGMNSTQMRIVLVGSPLHGECVEGTQLKTLKKIPNKDLKIGHVYVAKSGKVGIFRGQMRKKSERKTFLAWLDYTPYSATRVIDEFESGDYQERYKKDRLGNVVVSKAHSYIKDLGSIDVFPNVVHGLMDGYWYDLEASEWVLLEDDETILKTLKFLQDRLWQHELGTYLAHVPRPVSPKVLAYIQEHEIPFDEDL